MSEAGFVVDSETLLRHAPRVEQVRADAQQAASAVAACDLHGGAFGVLCGFLPGVIGDMVAQTTTTIGGLRDEVGSTADRVRAMAAAYDRVDEAVAARLQQLTKALGE